jgi:hypothetical protein
MRRMDLLLIPTLAYRSNTNILVHDSFSRRLDDFDLHVELWEISNPTSGCAAQLSELEFELWAARELVVELQGGEQLRAAVPRVLENTLVSSRDDKWRGTTYPETGQHVLRLRECSRVDGHSGSEAYVVKVDWREEACIRHMAPCL